MWPEGKGGVRTCVCACPSCIPTSAALSPGCLSWTRHTDSSIHLPLPGFPRKWSSSSALGLLVHPVNMHGTQATWKKPGSSDVKTERQVIKQEKFPAARHARGYERWWVVLKGFECMGSCHIRKDHFFADNRGQEREGGWVRPEAPDCRPAWIWATQSRADSLDREHGREAWLMGLSARWKWRDYFCKREWEGGIMHPSLDRARMTSSRLFSMKHWREAGPADRIPSSPHSGGRWNSGSYGTPVFKREERERGMARETGRGRMLEKTITNQQCLCLHGHWLWPWKSDLNFYSMCKF